MSAGANVRSTTRAALALLALVLPLRAQEPPAPPAPAEAPALTEVIEEKYPSGKPRSRAEARAGPDGKLVRHGAAQAWHENGKLESQGHYEDGVREGIWVFWHPSGTKRAEGAFLHGLREGPWEFRRADGKQDKDESGRYHGDETKYASGALRWRGELREDRRHGAWQFFWENGVVQLEGAYRDGVREGDWLFHYPDGAPDGELFAGRFQADRRVRPVKLEADATRRVVELGIALDALPEPAAWTTLSPAALASLQADVDAAAAGASLGARRPVVPPSVRADARLGALLALRSLRGLDLDTVEGVARHKALAALADDLSGRLVPLPERIERPWTPEQAATAGARLAAFWLVTAADHELWSIGIPGSATRGNSELPRALAPLAMRRPFEPPPALAAPASGLYASRFAPELSAAWGKHAARMDECLRAALGWLAAHQEADGSWDAEAGFAQRADLPDGPEYRAVDAGLTSLAALCLLGSGSTTQRGPHARSLAAAIGWLVRQQNPPAGVWPNAIYTTEIGSGATRRKTRPGPQSMHEHAWATLALCEAAAFSDDPVLRASAEAAVQFCIAARNPYAGWHHAFPPDGESDTVVTSQMALALQAAEQVGIAVPKEAWEGALHFLQEATDPATGRVGYGPPGSAVPRIPNVNDGYPAELSETTTAASLLVRVLRGARPAQDPGLARQAGLIARSYPRWDPLRGCDAYYWFLAAHAAHQIDLGGMWEIWSAALPGCLADHQRRDGEMAGSWDPVGPWSFFGGRTSTTALMTLAALAPVRYAPIERKRDAK